MFTLTFMDITADAFRIGPMIAGLLFSIAKGTLHDFGAGVRHRKPTLPRYALELGMNRLTVTMTVLGKAERDHRGSSRSQTVPAELVHCDAIPA